MILYDVPLLSKLIICLFLSKERIRDKLKQNGITEPPFDDTYLASVHHEMGDTDGPFVWLVDVNEQTVSIREADDLGYCDIVGPHGTNTEKTIRCWSFSDFAALKGLNDLCAEELVWGELSEDKEEKDES